MTQAELSGRGLTKRYGERDVVHKLDIGTGGGEVVGLLGPNGAGKTTTFNMIVGRIRPTAGQVHLGSTDITQLPMFRRARLGITYLPQEPSIFRNLSVAENVAAILETVESNRSERRRRLQRLLEELDLAEKANRRGDSLSVIARRNGTTVSAVSRSHARWCSIPSSCCSTNRSRESTRSPCSTFNRSL